jgi:uncharacterized protein YigA (DUF484 family)
MLSCMINTSLSLVNHSQVQQIANDLQTIKKFAKKNPHLHPTDSIIVDIHTFAFLQAAYNAKRTMYQHSETEIYFVLELGKKNYRLFIETQPITIQLC